MSSYTRRKATFYRTKNGSYASSLADTSALELPVVSNPILGSLVSEIMRLDPWTTTPTALHVNIADLDGATTLRVQNINDSVAHHISQEALRAMMPEAFTFQYFSNITALVNKKRYEHSLAIIKSNLLQTFDTIDYDLKLASGAMGLKAEFPFYTQGPVGILRPNTLPAPDEAIALLGKSEVIILAKDEGKIAEHQSYVFPYIFWDNLTAEWVLSLSGFTNLKIGSAPWNKPKDIQHLIDYMLDEEAMHVAGALLVPDEAQKVAEVSALHSLIREKGEVAQPQVFNNAIKETVVALQKIGRIKEARVTSEALELGERILAYKIVIRSNDKGKPLWRYRRDAFTSLRDDIVSVLGQHKLHAISGSSIQEGKVYSGSITPDQFQYMTDSGYWDLPLWVSYFAEDEFKQMNVLNLLQYAEVAEKEIDHLIDGSNYF